MIWFTHFEYWFFYMQSCLSFILIYSLTSLNTYLPFYIYVINERISYWNLVCVCVCDFIFIFVHTIFYSVLHYIKRFSEFLMQSIAVIEIDNSQKKLSHYKHATNSRLNYLILWNIYKSNNISKIYWITYHYI